MGAHSECPEEKLLITRGLEPSRGRDCGRVRGGKVRKGKSRDQCYNFEEYGHHSNECPIRRIDEKKEETTLFSEGFSTADDELALL